MGNITDQPSSNIQNKRNGTLATVSIIFGILGYVLPCLAFYILGFILNDYLIDKMGLHEFNLLNVCIPIAFWIVGPIAIILGNLSSQKRDPVDNPGILKNNARIGIALGVLTIPCVLLPLLLWLLLVYACRNGC